MIFLFCETARRMASATSSGRAVSRDGGLPEGAEKIADPTLEEAYLAFMAARGRADVALAEEAS